MFNLFKFRKKNKWYINDKPLKIDKKTNKKNKWYVNNVLVENEFSPIEKKLIFEVLNSTTQTIHNPPKIPKRTSSLMSKNSIYITERTTERTPYVPERTSSLVHLLQYNNS